MTENTTKVRGYPGTRKAKDSQRLWHFQTVAWAQHAMHCSEICALVSELSSKETPRCRLLRV
jgi:hypothetical protein